MSVNYAGYLIVGLLTMLPGWKPMAFAISAPAPVFALQAVGLEGRTA